MSDTPVALITGGARRIGAAIARQLHSAGWQLVIHYRHSHSDARQLADELNGRRAASVQIIGADLCQLADIHTLADRALACFGKLSALINNASSFYPTPIGEASEADWDDLIGSNLKAPFFLSQRLAPALAANRGCIINIADIHADRPLKDHSIYCIAKAGNVMLTKTLARELAPDVRVNGIAPGAIAWPEDKAALTAEQQQAILKKIALGRTGEPADIARTTLFLLADAPYISGQIIAVDGGRTLQG